MNLEEIEEELKAQAQTLGDLNMQLSKVGTQDTQYQQQNEQVSLQIMSLQNKIAKKKKLIEQENKDKMIIHQKLIQAEEKKQELQINVDQTQQPQYEKAQIFEKPVQKLHMEKDLSAQETEKKEEKQVYENQEKGEYQPPLLMENHSEEEDEEEENEEQILSSLRQKLQTNNIDDDDDQ